MLEPKVQDLIGQCVRVLADLVGLKIVKLDNLHKPNQKNWVQQNFWLRDPAPGTLAHERVVTRRWWIKMTFPILENIQQ